MDKKREVAEWCPHCEGESIHIMTSEEIINSKGKVRCSDCGIEILLCSECEERQCYKQPECFEFKPIDDEAL